MGEDADASPQPKSEPNDAASRPSTSRRAYTAPELIEYGTVAKLTQTGGQTVQDFFVLRRMMTCL